MTSATEARRRLRAALAAGRRVTGTFVKLPTVDSVDLARQAGFDFVVVDGEHSALPDETVLALVRHAAATGLAALVRVPAVNAAWINRVLESGAAGVQLSMLTGAAETSALVAAVRYSPHGERSVSLAHPAAGFGATDLAAYLAAEDHDPPLLVGQIETATTRDPLPAVLDGLDVAFVGTTDLAVSLGIAGAADQSALAARVAEVAAAAHAAGTAFGGWVARPDAGLIAASGLGSAAFVIAGSDLQLLGSALRETAAGARDLPGPESAAS
ncbi:siderophore biosynthesis protein SbnG [Microtetraspora sp. AC03309]|uniref:HpcH/HpaI aldolase family protein n=1 Tax=Microtetraspora sp. AC03309 TaxID=2779376 RepID=UPI001E325F3D|nr:aldolase/citrate lyase family protein [Microtetraspora sp. AC03309]MCC5579165.1 siderophore biosynthesis protein SbnG [Microtetraspora sp. AC03309]